MSSSVQNENCPEDSSLHRRIRVLHSFSIDVASPSLALRSLTLNNIESLCTKMSSKLSLISSSTPMIRIRAVLNMQGFLRSKWLPLEESDARRAEHTTYEMGIQEDSLIETKISTCTALFEGAHTSVLVPIKIWSLRSSTIVLVFVAECQFRSNVGTPYLSASRWPLHQMYTFLPRRS